MAFDLVDIFKTYFELRLANTQEDLHKIFKLRYDVFCKEFSFEDESNCPCEQEQDKYDPYAIEALLMHPEDNQVAGCIRLLLPNIKTGALPFETFCKDELKPEKNCQFAEVSRLTIAKDFRRRQWDGKIPSGVSNEVSQLGRISRSFPLPAVSMIFAGAALSRLFLLDYVYAMMEPRLAYAMGSYGVHFEQAGEIAQYHGERAPYRIQPMQIWETVMPELKPLLNFIYFKLSQTLPKPVPFEPRKAS